MSVNKAISSGKGLGITIDCKLSLCFFSWDLPHARLNSHNGIQKKKKAKKRIAD